MANRARRIVPIPLSTERTIIFSFDYSMSKFNTQDYHPSMTSHKIPIQEISQFLQGIENHLRIWNQVRGYKILTVLKILFLITTIALVIIVPVSFLSPPTDISARIPIMISIFAGFIVLLLIVTAFYRIRGKRKFKEVTGNIQVYISERNPFFKPRGFSWATPHKFPSWIELWNENIFQSQANHLSMQTDQMTEAFSPVTVPETRRALTGETFCLGSSEYLHSPRSIQMQIQAQQQGRDPKNYYNGGI